MKNIIPMLGWLFALLIITSLAGCFKSPEFRYNIYEGLYYISEAFKVLML
jgi:hypothetical protein